MGSVETNPCFTLDGVAEFFCSPVIKILAGSERQALHIHILVLSTSESPSLRALVSDKWNPSEAEPIDWSHTDSATVKRFLTWLYAGDYTIPEPCPLHNNPPITEEDLCSNISSEKRSPVCSRGGETERAASTSDQSQDIAVISTPIVDVSAVAEQSKAKHDKTAISTQQRSGRGHCKFDTIKFPHQSCSYQQPMLALAHLYCFAAYHLCSTLQGSTFQRIVEIMYEVDCSQQHAASDLAKAIRYIYENTRSGSEAEGPIRDHVSQFVAENFEGLMHDELEAFYVEGGDFTLEVAIKLRKRLLGRDEVEELMQKEQLQKENRDLNVRLADLNEELTENKRRIAGCKRCHRRMLVSTPSIID